MGAILNRREQHGVADACRLIRNRWSAAERLQRRRIAEARQQELWQLLEATCGPSAKATAGIPAPVSDRHAGSFR